MRRTAFAALLALSLTACKSKPEPKVTAEPAVEAPAAAPIDPPEDTETPLPLVVTDAEADQRDSPNKKGHIVRLLTGKNAFFGKLSMEPGGEVPVHRDATEEYIYILEGTGVMTIDGKDYEVGPTSAIYMPPNAEVSFKNGAEKLVAIQVFAGPEPAVKYDKWIGSETGE